jgi:hypothetical protein
METNQKPTGNEAVLFEREGVVLDKVYETRKYAEELKGQYGSWENIPNKLRTEHANMMRDSGCLYNPINGWELPNSHQLSSLVPGSFLQG